MGIVQAIIHSMYTIITKGCEIYHPIKIVWSLDTGMCESERAVSVCTYGTSRELHVLT